MQSFFEICVWVGRGAGFGLTFVRGVGIFQIVVRSLLLNEVEGLCQF